MSPFRYQLVMENQLLYQAAPVIDRLSSQEESSHYIYCAARQSSNKRPGALS